MQTPKIRNARKRPGSAKIGLRDWNIAQRKAALAFALREQLTERTLDDIATSTLCHSVSISEATFYNYFPRKVDLVSYLARLHTLKLSWHASQKATTRETLNELFDQAAKLIGRYPWVAEEILCRQHLERHLDRVTPLTAAERLAAFPDLESIDTVGNDLPMPLLLRKLVQEGLSVGDLPPSLHAETVADLLFAVFLATPLACTWGGRAGIEKRYRRQLDLIWDRLLVD